MDDTLAAKIRERAYLLWEREGRPEGMELEHWLCAEAELSGAQPAPSGSVAEPTREGTVAAAKGSAAATPKAAEPKSR